MNELKSVLKHLEDKEINLSSEKVELNMMKDFISDLSKAESSYDAVYKELGKISSLAKMAEESRRDQAILGNSAEKLQKAFKELGLNPDEKVNRALKVWEARAKAMGRIAAAASQLDKL